MPHNCVTHVSDFTVVYNKRLLIRFVFEFSNSNSWTIRILVALSVSENERPATGDSRSDSGPLRTAARPAGAAEADQQATALRDRRIHDHRTHSVRQLAQQLRLVDARQSAAESQEHRYGSLIEAAIR